MVIQYLHVFVAYIKNDEGTNFNIINTHYNYNKNVKDYKENIKLDDFKKNLNVLIDIIQNNGWFKTLGDKINISISAEIEFWKTVVNKRQCWIAQYGIWKDIIIDAQKHIEISEQDLPCNKGFCPYTRDAELRHTDDDPGAPCPIHSDLSSMPIDKKYMDMVHIEASYRPAFWQKHINKLKEMQ